MTTAYRIEAKDAEGNLVVVTESNLRACTATLRWMRRRGFYDPCIFHEIGGKKRYELSASAVEDMP